MANKPVYFTGDDWTINVTLRQNGVVYDASAATAVNAAVVDITGVEPTALIASTAQSSGTAGADWTNGLIVVKFAAANTGITTYGKDLLLEIQVTDAAGEKTTWPRQSIRVEKGIIA